MVWRTIPTISKAAGNAAHVILMFYSSKSYYGIQKTRSKSALAEIFNIIPTSLAFSIWLARMRERGRQLSHVGLLKVKLSKRSLLREEKKG